MNIILWALAGGAIGWGCFMLFGLNEHRGRFASLALGAIGGVIGGVLLAPMTAGSVALAGSFDFHALFIAAATAGACLAIGNIVANRYGI